MRIWGKLFTFASAVAVGVIGTAPEWFTGVGAFLGDTLDHRFTALRAKRGVFGDRLFRAILESFGCKRFGETAFYGERS